MGTTAGNEDVPSYFRRMRLRTVGTVQITPPLPNEEWAPLWGPFFIWKLRRFEPAKPRSGAG